MCKQRSAKKTSFLKKSSNKEASCKKIKHPIIEEEFSFETTSCWSFKKDQLFSTNPSLRASFNKPLSLSLSTQTVKKTSKKLSFLRKLELSC
jgi:hypothetical protein